jgi:hypothetical protein
MPILGGVLLIGLGILFLLGQLFENFDFWNIFWPSILVVIGVLLFAGMLAGGKSSSGLAIPATILIVLGVMMFFQNLFDYWDSWSYSWTLILFSVGLGIYISGVYAEKDSRRSSGIRLMKLAVILFIIFGIFFELILRGFGGGYLFPLALILLGLYLLVRRPGRSTAKQVEIPRHHKPRSRQNSPQPTNLPSRKRQLLDLKPHHRGSSNNGGIMKTRSIGGPLILIAIGILWLLALTNNISISNLWALAHIVPFALIAIGISLLVRAVWPAGGIIVSILIAAGVIVAVVFAPRWDGMSHLLGNELGFRQ